ncbi:hypothetical protein GGI24_006351, partial [Coemansia furcata]
MEWTPAMAKPPPIPGTAGVRAPAGPRVVGRPRVPMVRPPQNMVADDSQGMDVDTPQPPAQAVIQHVERPAAQTSAPGVASIPTIYDILGISEQAPASTKAARGRRARNRARSSTVSHVPAVSFAPMPAVPVAAQAPSVLAWPQTQAPRSDPIMPSVVPSVETTPPLMTHTIGDVADTAPALDVGPEPKTSKSKVVAASRSDNPLRAMVSLDDLESSADERAHTPEAPIAPQAAASSPLVPPRKPVVVAPVAKIAASPVTPAKPRDAKTSSPRLGTADPVGAGSLVPKILSFQEIMERKRRKLAETEASSVASSSPVVEVTVESPAAEPTVEP